METSWPVTEFQLILSSYNFRNTSTKWLRSHLWSATSLPWEGFWHIKNLSQKKKVWINSLQAKETRLSIQRVFSTMILMNQIRIQCNLELALMTQVVKTSSQTWWWMLQLWTSTCMRQMREQKVSKMLLINLQVEEEMNKVWGFRTCSRITIMELKTKKQDRKELV